LEPSLLPPPFPRLLSISEEAFWWWLAGLIDGEGSIRCTKKKNVHVLVANTNLTLISTIWHRLKRGEVRVQIRQDGRRKPLYTWRVFNQEDAEFVLRNVADKLVVKAERALEALSVINSRKEKRRKVRELWARVKELYEQGLSQREIAERVGVSYQYVHDILRDYLKMPPRTVRCLVCGKEFVEHKGAKYCSSRCREKAYYLRHRERKLAYLREYKRRKKRQS